MHVDISNLDMLKDIIGDELKEVLNIYLESTPETLLKLEDAVASKTLATVQSQAHSLKGSSANVGANNLSMLSAELEQNAKNNHTDNMSALLIKIQTENIAVAQALKDYINTF
ncbi:Hpt domain-containing protein [Thiomicrorhabdus sp. Milos-T2]|uniref:Hpt domain-containing protein n=1 Tax=Thiomicrorhabdus sp. Milos-T2 TaxID=90814 RepID=UPI000494BA56|nr:Hpt domain-containing protein [Thiomicrorhabdus sp. Milos-T2]